MTLRSWISELFARTPRTIRKATTRCRPTFEALEDRVTPAHVAFTPVTDVANPFKGFDIGFVWSQTLGDVDGDGDLDALVGEGNGRLEYFQNTGTANSPVYAQPPTRDANPFYGLNVGRIYGSKPTLGDVDGDGDLDALAGNGEGALVYFLNTGTSARPVYVKQTGTTNPFDGFNVGYGSALPSGYVNGSAPTLGDVDGDGDLDALVGAQDNGTLVYFQNTGTATSPLYARQTGTANPFYGFNLGFESSPSLGDVDGDGDLDALVGEEYGKLQYFQNTGTATSPVYARKTGPANPFDGFDVGNYSTLALGDVDGDGDLDALVGELKGTLLYFRQNRAPVLDNAIADRTFSGPGSHRYTVPANTFLDLDHDTLTYNATQVGGAALPAWLSFNPATRTFNGNPEASDTSPIQVRVTASAPDGKIIFDDFQLTLGNVNDAPAVITLSVSSIAENRPSGSTVGTFNTLDPDSGDSHTYTLVNGASGTDNALFTLDASGNLKTAAVFDFEARPSYLIRVRSTDTGSLFIEKVFTIRVTNVNEAPTVAAPGAPAVFEDVNTAITGVTVGDPDSGILTVLLTVDHGTLTLGTTAGLTVNGNGNGTVALFGNIANLNASLASLKYRGSLDYNGADILRIAARDGILSTEKAVPISVLSVNDIPSVSLPGDQTAVEDVDSAITGITVGDPDGGNLTVALTVDHGTLTLGTSSGLTVTNNGSGAVTLSGSIFNLNFSLASLKYRSSLNYSGADVLRIVAGDGILSTEKVAPISVFNVNDAPTVSLPAGQSTLEEMDTAITGITVGDPDGGNLTVALTVDHGTLTLGTSSGLTVTNNGSGAVTLSGSIANLNFSLASLKYRGNLDYSGEDVLRIVVGDGSLATQGFFPISVTNVNDAPTDITLSVSSIAENQPSGTTVGTFNTTDPDVGDSHTYALVSGTGDADNAAFTLDASGNLKTAAGFDFEAKSSYSIRVRSTDAGGLSIEKIFTIRVTNVDEAPTVAGPGAQTAVEEVDKAITGITVGDPDGGSLTVTLSVSHGTLTVVTIALGVTVAGSGSDALTLSGSIADVNAALDSLKYRSSLNFSGADTLNIVASDGSLSTNGSVAIIVESVTY